MFCRRGNFFYEKMECKIFKVISILLLFFFIRFCFRMFLYLFIYCMMRLFYFFFNKLVFDLLIEWLLWDFCVVCMVRFVNMGYELDIVYVELKLDVSNI